MCTDFLLQATDQSVVNGRSMEYGIDLGSQILVGGRGTQKQSSAPDSASGLSWTADYGYVGLNANGVGLANLITDGMNEKGLAIGALWLPNYTQYSPTVSQNAAALNVALFASWVLGNFASVADVQAALPTVQIWADAQTSSDLPLHFAIHDASGASLVIEFLTGSTQGVVQSNPVAVMTNAPPFSWHLSNIGNYVGLVALDAAPLQIGEDSYSPPGHGSGLRGVPGDSTPPSRFIRTLFQKQFATPPKDSTEASSLALHLLNTVDIPQGTSVPRNILDGDDYTQWVVIKALTDLTFSYRTAGNPTLMQVSFSTLDLSTVGELSYAMPSEPAFIDITAALSPNG